MYLFDFKKLKSHAFLLSFVLVAGRSRKPCFGTVVLAARGERGKEVENLEKSKTLADWTRIGPMNLI